MCSSEELVVKRHNRAAAWFVPVTSAVYSNTWAINSEWILFSVQTNNMKYAVKYYFPQNELILKKYLKISGSVNNVIQTTFPILILFTEGIMCYVHKPYFTFLCFSPFISADNINKCRYRATLQGLLLKIFS